MKMSTKNIKSNQAKLVEKKVFIHQPRRENYDLNSHFQPQYIIQTHFCSPLTFSQKIISFQAHCRNKNYDF